MSKWNAAPMPSTDRNLKRAIAVSRVDDDQVWALPSFHKNMEIADHIEHVLAMSEIVNPETTALLVDWIRSNNFSFMELVGCCQDGRIPDLIEVTGIDYYTQGGGIISSILRDYVRTSLKTYHKAKADKKEKKLSQKIQKPQPEETPDEPVEEEVVDEDLPSVDEPINDYYEITETLLGEGQFGSVLLGKSIKSKEEVAIKVINKSNSIQIDQYLQNEIDVLRQCKHPNIVALKAVFETPKILYIVMELVSGGELYDEIVKRNAFSEKDASIIMKQTCSALEYIHKLGIIHRDLKLENLLLVDKGATGTDLVVKLADFGLSRIYQKGDFVQTACGTPFYVAPEVLLGTGYGSPVDMWSAGVMMYILLSGRLPFHAENEPELFNHILSGTFQFKSPQFDNVSEEAKDLIKAMIIVESDQRITAEQAMKHPWITGNTSDAPLHDSLYRGLSKLSLSRKEM
eukprot:TRINITY_DN3523_c0_g1_i2.p1 TRINITY_DN3523_c0_g1~~TRINITY_DN3523_c0_g1_i2.p1  ORF type:complete len:467 (-),score=118.17 TRINITY_DN3523_c0_g1_i2:70-1443(-)